MRAIRAGKVPATCLLGGWVVWKLANAAHDPCASCSGPRERCKGRARAEESELGPMDQKLLDVLEAYRAEMKS